MAEVLLLDHITTYHQYKTGSGDKTDEINKFLASLTDDGITTLSPGIWENQECNDCECCAPCSPPLFIMILLLRMDLHYTPVI